MDATESSTTGGAAPGSTARRPRWTRTRTVVVAAVVTGPLVYLVGTLLGVDPQVRSGTGTFEVPISFVIGASLTAALGGWGVRALLLRTRSGGRAAWYLLCAAVLLVSLAGPLGAANPGAVALLTLEHLAVGGVIMFGLAGATAGGGRVARRP
ncbi:DUF6069 family protein [Isoptericola cucumis]|uniref:DUF6069 family protein n=1 Tax=Isoptericola cucumis TaxID=1776856 RepID=UPI003208730C